MSRQEFTELFRHAADGLTWEQIAAACKASKPTVQRWYYGMSAPHRVGRQSALDAVALANDKTAPPAGDG